jgi:soluble lytic murein transglycosylase-like protein
MRSDAARRAVALFQLGRDGRAVEDELARAFGETPADLDPAFAALARILGSPALELRAAENATERDIVLTSLYPVPDYAPQGGFTLDRAVVLAFARQESRFDAGAVSSAGARGLMQIMPATAALVAHDPSLKGRNRTRLDDARYSLTLGQAYLGDLLERENGNLVALAAAYNGGEGNVPKWMAGREDDPLLFIESLPVPETRDYIKRVMMNLWMYRLRLREPMTGVDDAASGAWPIYGKDSHG